MSHCRQAIAKLQFLDEGDIPELLLSIMSVRHYSTKIIDIDAMAAERARLRDAGKVLVFTNGCFDILHPGHVDYLAFARAQGDVLAVGMNSDSSVRLNKGPARPIVSEDDRARVLAALEVVDYVILFDSEEPVPLIERILPDILVKGEDWAHFVSGREIVEASGGRVVLAPLVKGRSTTNIIERILATSESRGVL